MAITQSSISLDEESTTRAERASSPAIADDVTELIAAIRELTRVSNTREPRLLNGQQAAARLGIDLKTLRQLRDRGYEGPETARHEMNTSTGLRIFTN